MHILIYFIIKPVVMFQSITWGLYLKGLTITAVIYYAVILAVYFRTELIIFFKNKWRPQR